MNVFIDTEFTDLLDPILISIGLVADTGEEFYAEVPYPDEKCTPFVREAVLPQLGRNPDFYCSVSDLGIKLRQWLQLVRREDETVYLCFDYTTDWDLFLDSIQFRIAPWMQGKLINSDIDEIALYKFYKETGLSRHHALNDALANKFAYRPIIANEQIELRKIKRIQKNWREKLPKQFIRNTLRAKRELKAGMVTPYVFGRIGKKQIFKKRSFRIFNMLNGEDTARSTQSFETTETEEKENLITLDLTSYALGKLHVAADLLGISLVDFAIQAGFEKAEKIIAQHKINKTRQAGSMHGDIFIADDFDAPLTISAQIQNIPDANDDSDWVRNPITQEPLDALNGRAPSPLDVLKHTVMRYDDPLDPVICPDDCNDEKQHVLTEREALQVLEGMENPKPKSASYLKAMAEYPSGFTENDAFSLSKAGLKAFFNICRDWQLTSDQEIILLGAPIDASYENWKNSPETALLDHETLVRISYLLGVYKALQILLPVDIYADAWIRKPNDAPLFGGKSALDFMLSGNVSGLFLVRQHLDSELSLVSSNAAKN